MFLGIMIDAFRDVVGPVALLAILSIVYGVVRRRPLPALLGLSFWVLLFGYVALTAKPDPIQPEEVVAEGDCIVEGTTTFCHELRHVRTTATEIPPAQLFGRAVVTLGFDFQGQRSCRTAKGNVVADFRLTMHGISEPVVSDYPDMMARVLPSPAKLERYRIGRHVGIHVGPQPASSLDPAALLSALGFDGMLLPNGSQGDVAYVLIEYVSVAESLAACLAHSF